MNFITGLILIVYIVFIIIIIALLVKIWRMTDDIRVIKNMLSEKFPEFGRPDHKEY